MQVSALMFGQREGEEPRPAVPMPVYRMAETMTQQLAVIMRSFSIQEITLELVQSGHFPVTNIKFKRGDYDDKLPSELMDIRVEILRGIMKTAFERFGLGTIKVALSAEEQAEVEQYWDYLRTGVQTPSESDTKTIEFENIPIPYETDPRPVQPLTDEMLDRELPPVVLTTAPDADVVEGAPGNPLGEVRMNIPSPGIPPGVN